MKNIIWLLAVFSLTAILFSFSYRVWKYDYLTYPLTYKHDGIEALKLVKNIQSGVGHWQNNPQLGYPFGSNLYVDFPSADYFSLTLIKLLSQLKLDHFQIFNLYVFTSYLFVAGSAFLILRKLKIKPFYALLGSLTFSFLPYHQIRTEVGHIFLLQYFSVPLTIYLAIKLGDRKFLLNRYLTWPKLLPVLLFMIAIGSTGTVYYAFFSIGIWLGAGLIGYFWHQNRQAIFGSIFFALITGLIVVANLAPSLIFQHKYGSNLQVQRDPIQVEEFGLRVNRLFAPLGEKMTKYYSGSQHEQKQYLGLAAALGLLIAIYLSWTKTEKNDLRLAGLLSLFIIVWASTGTLAYPLAYLSNLPIRSYGRISIYIAFLGLFVFFRLLQKQRQKLPIFFLNLLVIFGLFQQLNAIDPHLLYWETKNRFDQDRNFVQKIENVLALDSAILQLPIKKYPEARGECLFDSYDHFRPYLHSSAYNWSFGAVTGRAGGDFYQEIELLSPLEQLEKTEDFGFSAVLIDTGSCLDSWKIQAEIIEKFGGTLHTSEDFRYALVELEK